MKTSIQILIATVALAALAVGSSAQPAKPPVQHTPPPPDPDVIRQGGDTMLDAPHIQWPVDIEGTTVGYTDDYDEACPYTQSTSPDVVYRFTVDYESIMDIDLYGSSYDTKVYVYREDMTVVACNDDYYSDYTSRLPFVPMQADVKYFIVIDGYGGDFGDYVLSIFYPPPGEPPVRAEARRWAAIKGLFD
ncbi:hypothetical protein GF314_08660 [bacterium]|nr:hypothetical protein [bacterium]